MYIKTKFERKNEKWLESNIVVDFSKTKIKKGRKSNENFEEVSAFTKRRKLIRIEKTYSELEIQESFLRLLRISGRSSLATEIQLLLNIKNNDDKNDNNKHFVKFSAEEALALIEDTKLSKYQYESI